jgi:1,4-dihydroxy-2-naphthoyl-CoA hydrolase
MHSDEFIKFISYCCQIKITVTFVSIRNEKTHMINPQLTIDILNTMNKDSMGGHLGIEFTEIGEDYIKATMPVDHRTQQPFGLLHGGASAVLAETLGSVGATSVVNPDTHFCVGLEINVNHIKSAREGIVTGITRPVHIGNKTQIWEIQITGMNDELISVSRLTLMVLKKRASE